MPNAGFSWFYFSFRWPYPALNVAKQEMDEDVGRLHNHACNVDGQHQDQSSHSVGPIECPHETIQQCRNIGHSRKLPSCPPLYYRPECWPVLHKKLTVHIEALMMVIIRSVLWYQLNSWAWAECGLQWWKEHHEGAYVACPCHPFKFLTLEGLFLLIGKLWQKRYGELIQRENVTQLQFLWTCVELSAPCFTLTMICLTCLHKCLVELIVTCDANCCEGKLPRRRFIDAEGGILVKDRNFHKRGKTSPSTCFRKLLTGLP